MNTADKLTTVRIILAPLFCVVYLVPAWSEQVWTVPVLWVIFIVSELTDMLDGMVARKQKIVSDFGKLFDPFADTLTQITYFFCFILDGILPVPLFLLVVYREFGILFVRNLMLRRGVTLGARMGGKIKTVTYIAAAALALLAASVRRLRFFDDAAGSRVFSLVSIAATVVFALSVLLAILSFADYVKVYRKGKT
ncbi:MAG: CDP-diacylglycerol--glycerol-3-phosphate 3-phosphatidyltransferase [Treponema sp.]|jgi:CDP-diacylglycerol--glycerol-3-phosphate 3-phosphatidyltransferase|nr:CDP-diacylglycerol--glycerol-3-phosphate 3-phosphatidyltransferase [Treponema sp.]